MFYLHYHIFYNIFGTNLLTQCPVPDSVYYCPCIAEKGEKSILPKKSRNSYLKEASRCPKGGGGRGSHPLAGRPPGPARGWPRHLATWSGGATLGAPFGLYFLPSPKTVGEDSFSQNTLPFRRHDFETGISRSSCPGTLPEVGLISGGPSITMIASAMLRE